MVYITMHESPRHTSLCIHHHAWITMANIAMPHHSMHTLPFMHHHGIYYHIYITMAYITIHAWTWHTLPCMHHLGMHHRSLGFTGILQSTMLVCGQRSLGFTMTHHHAYITIHASPCIHHHLCTTMAYITMNMSPCQVKISVYKLTFCLGYFETWKY